jgi:hypothetical protein
MKGLEKWTLLSSEENVKEMESNDNISLGKGNILERKLFSLQVNSVFPLLFIVWLRLLIINT